VTAFCRHPGCLRDLSPGNVSGVCKAHIHKEGCRCATCCAPVKGSRKPRWRVQQRPELEAEGLLLPGLTLMKLQLSRGKP
jgi:predicted amidophosphoribosyltransferase